MTDETGTTEESQETKDLDYYMLHPDEMPGDPGAVEGIEDEGVSVADGAVEAVETIPTVDLRTTPEVEETKEPEVAPTPEAEPSEAEATAPETKPADPEEEKLPVATKDGKNTIPYGVLEGERKKAKEAEAERDKLREELEAQRNRTPETTQEASPTPPEIDVEEPDWDKLAEEYPEDLVKAWKATHKLAGSANERAARAEAKAAEYEQADEAEVRETSQTAIDKNPTLVNWQANHPEVWEQAKSVDALLRDQEEWETKTLEQRFAKVVEMTRAMNPDAPLVKDPAVEKTETDAAAKAALEKAGNPAATTLSDVPGGEAPPQSETEALENVSSTQLERKLLDMDGDKLEEYLNRQSV